MNFITSRIPPPLILVAALGALGMPASVAQSPTLSTTALASFGAQCINGGPYGPKTFTLNGSNLTTADLTIGPLNGYSFNTSTSGTFDPTLSITQHGGGFARVIYVKFSPTAVMDYSGNIPVGGGGAPGTQTAASGSGINPPPVVSLGTVSSITSSGATVGGHVTASACSATSAYGIEYSTVNGFANGSGTQVAGSNLSGNTFSCALSGLTGCTTYYYKAYGTNGGGTAYSSQGSFNTSGVIAPVATAGTSITAHDFVANWGAVAGATGYFLDVSTSPNFGTPAGNLIGWDFNDQNKIADSGIPANIGNSITTNATGYEGYGSGITGMALYKKGWHNGSGIKSWKIAFSTIGYSAISISSVQRSWNAGPKDFKIQYRVGANGSWTDVPGGTVTLGTDFLTGAVHNLPLPAACNDQPQVFVQWIMTSNARVSGSSTVLSGGSSQIEDIRVDAEATFDFLPGYEDLSVGNVTSYPVTGLDPSTTYYYRVRSGGSVCTSANSNTISVTTAVVPLYYSRSSGSVTDPIWSETPTGTAGPAIFSAATSMVVQDGHSVTNTANVDVNNVTVNTGGTLTLNAYAVFNVHGNAAFNGSLAGQDNSTFALVGSGAVTLASTGTSSFYHLTVNTVGGTVATGPLVVRGTLSLTTGTFDASGATVTLASDATGTGRLGPVASGANYLGNLTVQRYIPGGHTNWRMLGSPVAGQNVGHWQDDFFTAGYPGSAYPNFFSPTGSGIFWPSIRHYVETNPYPAMDSGMVGVTSNLQALIAGQGFMAWSGSSLNNTTPFTVDVTGAPNIGPRTLPMTFTSSGTLSADGWNLVSNPLPSPIAFDSISLGADVAAQYWVFDPTTGTLKTYSGGIGQGNVNGKIQSSQGFWLKANGPNLTTVVNENDKVDEHTGGVFGGSQQAVRPIVRLVVASTLNTFSDEATLVLDQGTPGHDAFDALKNPFRTAGAPQVAFETTTGEQLAIDFFGSYDTDISIPVRVKVDESGTYTVQAGITGMRALSCLSLEDLRTGAIIPLSDGASYSFTMNIGDDADGARFLLHATAPLPFFPENATCANTPDGQASVVVANGPVDITWTNASGATLATQTGIGNAVAIIDGLTAGSYNVHVSPIGVCGQLSTSFNITMPEPIEASATDIRATGCPNSTDGSISAAAFGGTGELSFLWNDGTTGPDFTGAAGEQLLTITDATGCSHSTSFTIPAGEGAVADFTVGEAVAGQPVTFTNNSGQSTSWSWDLGDGTTSTASAPEHTYTTAGTYTVTLTATDGTCSDRMDRPVHVSGATGIDGISTTALFNAYATPEQLVIDHPFGTAAVDVSVFDATGRMVMGRDRIVAPERITLSDRDLGTGVWFVRVKSGVTERTFRVPLIR